MPPKYGSKLNGASSSAHRLPLIANLQESNKDIHPLALWVHSSSRPAFAMQAGHLGESLVIGH